MSFRFLDRSIKWTFFCKYLDAINIVFMNMRNESGKNPDKKLHFLLLLRMGTQYFMSGSARIIISFRQIQDSDIDAVVAQSSKLEARIKSRETETFFFKQNKRF